MPLKLPEPDGVNSNGESVWACPKCGQLKTLEEYGVRRREDLYPGKNISGKQSYCLTCRGKG